MPVTRGAFLLATTATLCAPMVRAAGETADRIWTGGPIVKMNDAAMTVQALAEKGALVNGSRSAAGSLDRCHAVADEEFIRRL